MGERLGWKRLPKKLPRPVYASVYILLLLTAITSLSVTIVPRLTVSHPVPHLLREQRRDLDGTSMRAT